MNFFAPILFSLAIALTSCEAAPTATSQAPAAPPAVAKTKTESVTATATNADIWTMTVEGMSCAVNCAPTVAKALETLPGVRSATVDFEQKIARVEADPGTGLTVAAINASFENQGYFVESLALLEK